MYKKITILFLSVVFITSFMGVNAEEDLTITNVKATNITNNSALLSFNANGDYKCTLIHSTKDANLEDDLLDASRDRSDLIVAYVTPKSGSGENYYYEYEYKIDHFAKNYSSDIYDIIKGVFYYKFICDHYNSNGSRDRVISDVHSFETDASDIDLYPGYYMSTDKTTYESDEMIKLTLEAVNKNIAKYNVTLYGEKSLRIGVSPDFIIKSNIEINNGSAVIEFAPNEINGFNTGGSGTYLLAVCSVRGCTMTTTNSMHVEVIYSEQGQCTDTDNGNDYYHKGTCNTFTDYCIDNNQLREFWCEKNESKEEVFNCPNGCSNGACIPDQDISQINDKADLLYQNKIDDLLLELKELRDLVKEQQTQIDYLTALTKDLAGITEVTLNAINNFITYGVDNNTKKLGAGERAAVMHSYKAAFNKLPKTEKELADAIKIANGRWPTVKSEDSEKQAKEQFRKIYKRIVDMDNSNDNAAITVMAYGLRQKAENRNLDSEKVGINTFKGIYGHAPQTTEEWNIMQAITYSGAGRQADADKDYLPDSREITLGTDPNNADSDGDGHLDGIEVENGFNPLGN